jgi:hypothetical protein
VVAAAKVLLPDRIDLHGEIAKLLFVPVNEKLLVLSALSRQYTRDSARSRPEPMSRPPTTSELAALAQERQFLTTVEAAEILGLKPRTLEALRVDGTGPRYYKMGPGKRARVVYTRGDLDDWVAQFAFRSTSEY